ncbi:MAG: hypothetical protein GXY44_00085 [Phycisphaerales bacterium]|nr:hypothetical protein [Phycisphaerales bacterium]
MKWVVPLAMLGLSLGAVDAARGFPTLTIVDTVGDPNSVTVDRWESFNVLVHIDTDVSMVALQLRLQEITAVPSGSFRLNSVSFSTPPWSNDPGSQVVPALPDLMDGPDYKSGYILDLATDLVNGTGTGEFYFATINLTYAGALMGEYRLNLSDILYGDTNFDDFTDALTGQDYIVTVIPAPGAAVLGMIGLGCVGWVKKRLEKRGETDYISQET